jgi:uncharacterized OB-fold protein
VGVPVADGLFRLDDDGTVTLLGGRSASSGLLHFPLAPVCPYTGADDVHAVDLPRSGRLWGWTEVTTAAPSYLGPVPYGLGVVELDTGDDPVLRVVGRIIDCSPADLTFGRAMLVVGEQLAGDDGGAVVWAFRPASESDR